jgi:hypothetical protein
MIAVMGAPVCSVLRGILCGVEERCIADAGEAVNGAPGEQSDDGGAITAARDPVR